MGIATFLIAFVPTYASIGMWGAVILTIMRMVQGVGGHFGYQVDTAIRSKYVENASGRDRN